MGISPPVENPVLLDLLIKYTVQDFFVLGHLNYACLFYKFTGSVIQT